MTQPAIVGFDPQGSMQTPYHNAAKAVLMLVNS